MRCELALNLHWSGTIAATVVGSVRKRMSGTTQPISLHGLTKSHGCIGSPELPRKLDSLLLQNRASYRPPPGSS